MDSIEVIQPSTELSPYIKNYWFLKAKTVNQVQSIIPTGNINLYFHRGNQLLLESSNSFLPNIFICGQSTTYSNVIQSGITDMICVVFQPSAARMFFKEPMSELKGQSVDLDLLTNSGISELGKRLQGTFDNRVCVSLIESFLEKEYLYSKEYNLKKVTAIVNAVDVGNVNIENLTTISCLSYKQFKRIFAEYVGLNPKEFMRIVRFQRVLHVLQTTPNINFTELTYICEYYDQSHLINEPR